MEKPLTEPLPEKKKRAESKDKSRSHSSADTKSENSKLSLQISTSLHRKLLSKAQAEGVSIEEFASELLAEGLVLRAWEIMERKGAMRGQSSGGQGANQGRGQQGRFRSPQGQGNFGRRQGFGSSYSNNGDNQQRSNYRNIMEDSANFLEYVRNQEKKRR